MAELTSEGRNEIRLTLLEQTVRKIDKSVENTTQRIEDINDTLDSVRHVIDFLLVLAKILTALGIIFYPIRALINYFSDR